jgi:hypothetical protein
MLFQQEKATVSAFPHCGQRLLGFKVFTKMAIRRRPHDLVTSFSLLYTMLFLLLGIKKDLVHVPPLAKP